MKLNKKDRNRIKFARTGRGRRQDHATRGNGKRWKEWDDIGDKILFAARRAFRHLGGEIIEE